MFKKYKVDSQKAGWKSVQVEPFVTVVGDDFKIRVDATGFYVNSFTRSYDSLVRSGIHERVPVDMVRVAMEEWDKVNGQ